MGWQEGQERGRLVRGGVHDFPHHPPDSGLVVFTRPASRPASSALSNLQVGEGVCWGVGGDEGIFNVIYCFTFQTEEEL